ncbi:type II toxin-antitoxin system YafQ family toxin [Vibrio cholerae]|uniref:type II toxin-antitoxin system YafQ family toxin n=1 Tax=Vibrio cholerae TaxID=666 RepID=UPI0021D12CE6|nr:type II toxin-antitoxin system YafQ family toxin [Vibrio cholerae]MCU4197467.1 type II toxin-antitoxin system YafQ family toxin [Vibrio cholerae]MCU4201132.1 type II toxin-antitoxin system YafQ family toxin [Vibrio cholerae]MCU4225979.1 type II toxin-antitoxin system YafQ family toxin [Vibrio cholerae]MCU4233123.1 type II toxin-antitoxin system YafQ family toxin [Vibrio cholerae]
MSFQQVKNATYTDIFTLSGNVISKLQRGEKLEPKNVDHPLTGNWVGFRDCHIKPDLVLIYRVFNDQLQLARIGSHSDLF